MKQDFLEGQEFQARLWSGKLYIRKGEEKRIRLDFEAELTEALTKLLPDALGMFVSAMGPTGVTSAKYGEEVEGRLVEIGADSAPLTLEGVALSRIKVERETEGSPALLYFSADIPESEVGHWWQDHFGDTLTVRILNMQPKLV